MRNVKSKCFFCCEEWQVSVSFCSCDLITCDRDWSMVGLLLLQCLLLVSSFCFHSADFSTLSINISESALCGQTLVTHVLSNSAPVLFLDLLHTTCFRSFDELNVVVGDKKSGCGIHLRRSVISVWPPEVLHSFSTASLFFLIPISFAFLHSVWNLFVQFKFSYQASVLWNSLLISL